MRWVKCESAVQSEDAAGVLMRICYTASGTPSLAL